MKLVIGCPIKDRAWCLPQWWQAIEDQDVEHEKVCIYSESADETLQLLKDNDVTVLVDDRPGRRRNEIDGHMWVQQRYEYMSSMRNRLIEYCLEHEADYFFSLDSDVILPPKGLQQMLRFAETHEGVIAPAVNMTTGQIAWNVMAWKDREHPGVANRNAGEQQTGPADVVMAAMMLDRRGMECRWQSHTQGEDVGFCVDATAKDVPRWWLAEIHCTHLMRRV